MKTPALLHLCIAGLMLLAHTTTHPSLAQIAAPPPGVDTCLWQPGFQGSSPDSSPAAAVTWDDGTGPALYIGGFFNAVPGLEVPYIARWDGSAWSALGAGLDGPVSHLTVFDDGSGDALYAAGSFQNSGDQPIRRIAKWDGTEWSQLGSSVSGPINALHVFERGGVSTLVAAASFLIENEPTRVAEWDGQRWSPLGAGPFGTAADGAIYAFETFDSGAGPELYAGGLFSTFDGPDHLARWDGQAWQQVGAGVNDWVLTLETFTEGNKESLFVGGFQTAEGAQPGSYLARWDGSSWSSVGGGVSAGVYALTAFDDGLGDVLYALGDFEKAGGLSANGVARWNGTSWETVGPGLAFFSDSISSFLPAMAPFNDGLEERLIFSGRFTTVEGSPARYLAQWDGTEFSPVGATNPGAGTDSSILDMAILNTAQGSRLLAAGFFVTAGSSHPFGVAA